MLLREQDAVDYAEEDTKFFVLENLQFVDALDERELSATCWSCDLLLGDRDMLCCSNLEQRLGKGLAR